MSKNKFTEEVPLEVTEAVPAKKTKSEILAETKTPSSLEYLFINAVPATGFGEAVNLASFLEPICAQICREAGVMDYRMIDYGKGKALLLSALRQKKELPRILVIGREDSAPIAIEALLPRAKFVIHGV